MTEPEYVTIGETKYKRVAVNDPRIQGIQPETTAIFARLANEYGCCRLMYEEYTLDSWWKHYREDH